MFPDRPPTLAFLDGEGDGGGGARGTTFTFAAWVHFDEKNAVGHARRQFAQGGAHLTQVLQILCMRLQSNKTVAFVRGFLGFLGLVAGLHGGGTLGQALDALQPGLLWQLLEQVWVPYAARALKPGP